MNDKQINVRIAPALLKKIQMESMFADVKQQDFVMRVFQFFLSLPKDKRREVLRGDK